MNLIGGDHAGVRVTDFPPPLMANHDEVGFPIRGRIGLPHALGRQGKKPDYDEHRPDSPNNLQLAIAEIRRGITYIRI